MTETLYQGLTSRFLHDGCHNRAETICRRLVESGKEGVGKLWIMPSNLRYGRLTHPNPLFVDWLEGALFRLNGVPYEDRVYVHGETIAWRYHVLAAQRKAGDDPRTLVHDSTEGSLPAQDYLALLGTKSLSEADCPRVEVVSCFAPYGEALSPSQLPDPIRAELLRDIEDESPQHPSHWTSYWMNTPKSPGFSVESHIELVNAWHLRLEGLLNEQSR